MNKAILVGRITKDPELKRTNSDIPFVQFTIAVNRRYQNRDGERQADFINCIAWRQAAELLAKYIRKGSQIGVEGTIQTRTYDDSNGVRHYVTEVVCDTISFLDSKRSDEQGSMNSNQPQYGQQYQQTNQTNYQYKQPNNQYNNKEQENPFADIENNNISSDDLPF